MIITAVGLFRRAVCVSLAGAVVYASDEVIAGDLFVEGDGGTEGTVLAVESFLPGSPNLFITKLDSGTPNQNGGSITFENNHLYGTDRLAGVISGEINFNFSQPVSGVSQLGARIRAISDYTHSGTGLSTALVFGNFGARNFNGTGLHGFYERMRITSSGNVGIGTSNPVYLLDVGGPVRVQDLVVSNTILIPNSVYGGADSVLTMRVAENYFVSNGQFN
jgi:hypothetical protein